ncbi:V-type proton ATPase 16 kDa proteolipid subunit [Taenia crassiceps]|uniref:V-type proton ATPase 16 kDa proteolipid subunit n=1 Tax=Taenia crassiceps TaxID=6207 RepID=A0ABR4QTQ0_9CEST
MPPILLYCISFLYDHSRITLSFGLCLRYSKGQHGHILSLSHLGAGLSVGLSGLAAGYAIGVVGDAGVRAYCKEARFLVYTA